MQRGSLHMLAVAKAQWAVKARNIVEVLSEILVTASRPPGPDYPPQQFASWMDQCKAIGRDDLAQEIQAAWEGFLTRHSPRSHNWPYAVKVGQNSIKKNVFDRQEFSTWFAQQADLNPSQKKAATSIKPTPMPKNIPAIAIPKDDEQEGDWEKAAEKTKAGLEELKGSFADVSEYIGYLEEGIDDAEKKIETYGPGGDKEKTKSGKPSKFAGRVPKWQSQLKAYKEVLAKAKETINTAQTKVAKAEEKYNEAPVTTVAYEEKIQASNAKTLEMILDIKDLEQQERLLEKFHERIARQADQKAASSIQADVLDDIWGKIKEGFSKLSGWLSNITKSTNEFEELANIRY